MFNDYFDVYRSLKDVLNLSNLWGNEKYGSKKPTYTHAEMNKIKKRRAKKKVAKTSRKRNRHN